MSALFRHSLAPEKVVALAVAVAPAVWLAVLTYAGELGMRPVTEAIRISGDWALRLLWLVLLISPARRILSAPRLVRARRILGLGVFGLTALHLGLYALDLQFDWARIGLEILLRTYLTVGAAAMIGLAALAVSSNDRAVSWLGGPCWNGLHRWVYPIAALSLVHFLLRSRSDTFEPMLMFGLLTWLMGYRLIHRFIGHVAISWLLGLAIAASMLTATVETCWHAAATGVDWRRLLAAHLDVAYELRPAWWVLIAGLVATVAAEFWGVSPRRPISRMSASPAVAGSTRGQSAS